MPKTAATPKVELDQNGNRERQYKNDNKDEYNKERDSRTVFIKNLPFAASVDDLWETFGGGELEEECIECRFITNRETGTHKGLAFVEYSSKETAQKVIAGTWKVKGRPAFCMQAGGKKPQAQAKPNGNAASDRDKFRGSSCLIRK